jgi:predicted homoserine dehydrogenase-like protein
VVGRNTIVNENTVKVGINKDAIKIGFIGAGYMGYGMAHNLLKNNYSVSVIAHKNRIIIFKQIMRHTITHVSGTNEANLYSILVNSYFDSIFVHNSVTTNH